MVIDSKVETSNINNLILYGRSDDEPFCLNILQIRGILKATRIELRGWLYLDQGIIIGSTSISQFSGSIIQGSGDITSPSSIIRGRVFPGVIMTSCALCTNPPFIVDTKSSENIGRISFTTGTTRLIGAQLYVKALAPDSSDSLSFARLVFIFSPTSIIVDADGSVTSFTPITFQSIVVDVAPIFKVRSEVLPWLVPCLIASNCALTRGAAPCPECTPPTLDGTEPTTSVCGQSTSATTLSVTVSTTPCPSGGSACNPECQHGSCGPGNICVCPFSSGFGWSGVACDVPECPLDCNGAAAGTCNTGGGASFPACACNAPWSGSTCNSLTCSPACVNGGACVTATGSSSTCDCPAGFSGQSCEVVVPPGSCPPCGIHGACGGSATNFTCVCDAQWRGSSCQVPVCPGYVAGSSPNCQNNGICDLDGSSGALSCVCADGWGGVDCSNRVCPSQYCSNGGTCALSEATGTDPVCTCTAAWGGTYCTVARASSGTPAWVIPVAVVLSAVGFAILLAVGLILYRVWYNQRLVNVTRQLEADRMRSDAATNS